VHLRPRQTGKATSTSRVSAPLFTTPRPVHGAARRLSPVFDVRKSKQMNFYMFPNLYGHYYRRSLAQ
jgi:hypothetical protein